VRPFSDNEDGVRWFSSKQCGSARRIIRVAAQGVYNLQGRASESSIRGTVADPFFIDLERFRQPEFRHGAGGGVLTPRRTRTISEHGAELRGRIQREYIGLSSVSLLTTMSDSFADRKERLAHGDDFATGDYDSQIANPVETQGQKRKCNAWNPLITNDHGTGSKDRWRCRSR